jgi:preprotein translocase subunit SecG
MYFALMILIAVAVVALVLLLEHRGDPRTLEREYGSRPSLPNKSSHK